jgi:WD40 repeat protein
MGVYNLQTADQLWSISNDYQSLDEVEFIEEGRLILTTGADINGQRQRARVDPNYPVTIYCSNNGQVLGRFKDHTDSINWLSHSSWGVFSASIDGTIRLWNPRTGQEIMKLLGATGPFAFDLMQSRLVARSSSELNELQVWDLQKSSLCYTLRGHQNHVTAIAISPDGIYAASGSWDQSIKLWHLESGKEVMSLNGHNGGICSVAFAFGGKVLVSGAGDWDIKIWNMEYLQK